MFNTIMIHDRYYFGPHWSLWRPYFGPHYIGPCFGPNRAFEVSVGAIFPSEFSKSSVHRTTCIVKGLSILPCSSICSMFTSILYNSSMNVMALKMTSSIFTENEHRYVGRKDYNYFRKWIYKARYLTIYRYITSHYIPLLFCFKIFKELKMSLFCQLVNKRLWTDS